VIEMGVFPGTLERRPPVTQILWEVETDLKKEANKLAKYIKSNNFGNAVVSAEGFTMMTRYEKQITEGQFAATDNYNLVLLADNLIGRGLMAPSFLHYVLDYLVRDGGESFLPEKMAVVSSSDFLRLNELFVSPRVQFFEYGDLEGLVKFFKFGKAKNTLF
jgi:hypothetical protein